MELNKYITLVTFLPWVLIFIFSSLNNLGNKNYTSFTWEYLRKNLFKIFRLDTLFLIIVFLYFSSFHKDFVDKYLFAVMCIYLFVNSFYEKRNTLKKGFWTKNFLNIFLLFCVMIIPFIIYFTKKDLVFTYKIMLIYLFLEYIIIIIISYITKFIKKIFKRKKS